MIEVNYLMNKFRTKKRYAERPTPTALLNPRLDPIFKILFTDNSHESRVALSEFLGAIFEAPISQLRLLPNILSGETKDDKVPQFDLTCKIGDSTFANVEMQGHSHYKFFDNRAEYHVAHLLNHFVRRGHKWRNIPVAYQISVLDFVYNDLTNEGLNHYYMQTKDGYSLTNKLNIVFLELPKYCKCANMDVKKLTSIQRWAVFFLYADNPDYAYLIDDLAQEELGINMALGLLTRISRSERAWFRQNHYWDSISDYNSMKDDAEQEGLAKGMERGLEQGKIQGENEKLISQIKIKLSKGKSPEQIADELEESIEKINELIPTIVNNNRQIL